MTAADIPLHPRPARPGLRGLPLRRQHALRRAGGLGPVARRPADADIARSRHRMGRSTRRTRPALDLQAAPGREIPRRLPTSPPTSWSGTSQRTDEKAPQFDPRAVRARRAPISALAGVEKIDDHTVAFTTKVPDSLFPYMISYILMVEPVAAQGGQGRLEGLCRAALRHRPVQVRQGWCRTSAWSCRRNNDYWDKARVPKQDRLVLIPMPGGHARTAALLSGQVDWIEAPSPDAHRRAEIGRACRSSPTFIRTTGPTSSASSRRAVRPTCGCARRPITRSTAPT